MAFKELDPLVLVRDIPAHHVPNPLDPPQRPDR